MLTEQLNYDLPPQLIAQRPSDIRSRSKLLVNTRHSPSLSDQTFTGIVNYLRPGDCLVFNDTKVLPARFFAARSSGAKIEALFLQQDNTLWQVMLKNARRVKIGETIILLDKDGTDFCTATAAKRLGQGHWHLQIDSERSIEDILTQIGFAPLPPYIKHTGDSDMAAIDLDRYQTVYAKNSGAVAAPTAGLHFTPQLLDTIKKMHVEFAYVTLHVGAGTFKPVTAENLDDHQIHSERYSISPTDAAVINNCVENGGRIIAVGTTSVRTLETIASDRKVSPCSGSTQLFIQPGYEFKIVDGMVTNFHLPRSTLLALVAAFTGLENILTAYRHAIEKQYRFFSYGDAMLII